VLRDQIGLIYVSLTKKLHLIESAWISVIQLILYICSLQLLNDLNYSLTKNLSNNETTDRQ